MVLPSLKMAPLAPKAFGESEQISHPLTLMRSWGLVCRSSKEGQLCSQDGLGLTHRAKPAAKPAENLTTALQLRWTRGRTAPSAPLCPMERVAAKSSARSTSLGTGAEEPLDPSRRIGELRLLLQTGHSFCHLLCDCGSTAL